MAFSPKCRQTPHPACISISTRNEPRWSNDKSPSPASAGRASIPRLRDSPCGSPLARAKQFDNCYQAAQRVDTLTPNSRHQDQPIRTPFAIVRSTLGASSVRLARTRIVCGAWIVAPLLVCCCQCGGHLYRCRQRPPHLCGGRWGAVLGRQLRRQLGNNSTVKAIIRFGRFPPAAAIGSPIAAGSPHTCAVVSGGVQCWGSISTGGAATTAWPTMVSCRCKAIPAGGGATAVSAHHHHTLLRGGGGRRAMLG